MMTTTRKHKITRLSRWGALLALLVVATAVAADDGTEADETAAPSSFIVTGHSARAANEAVEAVGGEVTHELGIIRSVAATLTPRQLDRLREREPELRIHPNESADTDSDGHRRGLVDARGQAHPDAR